jgi:hypothetical protein
MSDRNDHSSELQPKQVWEAPRVEVAPIAEVTQGVLLNDNPDGAMQFS